MSKLRVGVLGLSHDHVWGNLAAIAGGDLGRVVAAADPDPRLRERLTETHGGAEALRSHDALLDRRDLDAVLVFADNVTRCWKQIIYFGRDPSAAPPTSAPAGAVAAPEAPDELPPLEDLGQLPEGATLVRDERGVRLAREPEEAD